MHIVLVEPEIPANTGNIARLCAATRSTLHLIHPLGFTLKDSATKRAGMDYLDLATIHEHPTLADCIQPATSYYLLTTKAQKPYWSVPFQPEDHLVFGRESKGLPDDWLRSSPERCITIPMVEPAARSLNLSTSVAIVLFEALRQQSMGA